MEFDALKALSLYICKRRNRLNVSTRQWFIQKLTVMVTKKKVT